jgi:hypothetical protein
MQRKNVDGHTVLAVAAFVAVGVLGAAVPPVPAAAARPECTVTLDEPIPVQPDSVVVWVRLSAPLEGQLAASFPAESKVMVAAVTRGEADPLMARLTLGTAEAVVGEYDITVKGERDATCSGKVKVGAAGSGGAL